MLQTSLDRGASPNHVVQIGTGPGGEEQGVGVTPYPTLHRIKQRKVYPTTKYRH